VIVFRKVFSDPFFGETDIETMNDYRSLAVIMEAQHGGGIIKRKQFLDLWKKIEELLLRGTGNTLMDNIKECDGFVAGKTGKEVCRFG
jgi:hypothetical protein